MGSHLAEAQLSVVTDRCPEKNTKRWSPSDQPLIGSTGIAHAHLHFCIDAHDGVYASYFGVLMVVASNAFAPLVGVCCSNAECP